MEITKVVKPFIRRGWPNTFANIVYKVIWENSQNYNKYSQWWDVKWQFE